MENKIPKEANPSTNLEKYAILNNEMHKVLAAL